MNQKLEYYSSKEISEILGCCRTKAYDEIELLNEELKDRYPNVKIFKNKIPIWFWNEKTKPLEERELSYEKNI